MTETPIIPSAIIPPGAPLPARPPAPPRRAPVPEWMLAPPAPPAPRPPVPPPYIPPPAPTTIDVHVTIGWAEPEPEPPSWWRRIRWGYNAGCLLCASPLISTWADGLASIRDSQGLAGAWTLAVIPLTVLAFLDNARRIEAAAAHPDLWKPKIRAATTRTLLWACIASTAITLPVTTAVYALTGVRT